MPTYYPIDEAAALQAKEMNSYYDYKPESATAAYRQEVDKAADIAEAQKARVDPMYHEKIDRLLDTYARSLPRTQREQTWLWDRLEALSVWENAALAALNQRCPPNTAVEMVNRLLSLQDCTVCLAPGTAQTGKPLWQRMLSRWKA